MAVRYDYRCELCHAERELYHSIKESPEVRCECGGECSRVISGAGVVFVGDWPDKFEKRRKEIPGRRGVNKP